MKTTTRTENGHQFARLTSGLFYAQLFNIVFAIPIALIAILSVPLGIPNQKEKRHEKRPNPCPRLRRNPHW